MRTLTSEALSTVCGGHKDRTITPVPDEPGMFEQLKTKGFDELVRIVKKSGKPFKGKLGKWRSIGLD